MDDPVKDRGCRYWSVVVFTGESSEQTILGFEPAIPRKRTNGLGQRRYDRAPQEDNSHDFVLPEMAEPFSSRFTGCPWRF